MYRYLTAVWREAWICEISYAAAEEWMFNSIRDLMQDNDTPQPLSNTIIRAGLFDSRGDRHAQRH